MHRTTEIYNALSSSQKQDQIKLVKSQKVLLDKLLLEMQDRATTLRGLAAIQAFKNYPGAVVISNLQSLKLDNAAAKGEFECSCCSSFGCSNILSGNLAKSTPKGEGCDSVDESPETGEKTIKSKFLETQVNIVAEKSRRIAHERIQFVKAPKQMNESDSIFQNLPKPNIKSDKDLDG